MISRSPTACRSTGVSNPAWDADRLGRLGNIRQGHVVADPGVRVIILRGAGRAFCAGFDFAGGFHHWDAGLTTDGEWDPGKDFAVATAQALGPVPRFMSLWRSPKPVIGQVHGWCVGGGSD